MSRLDLSFLGRDPKYVVTVQKARGVDDRFLREVLFGAVLAVLAWMIVALIFLL